MSYMGIYMRAAEALERLAIPSGTVRVLFKTLNTKKCALLASPLSVYDAFLLHSFSQTLQGRDMLMLSFKNPFSCHSFVVRTCTSLT